jgi:hypothetical protein
MGLYSCVHCNTPTITIRCSYTHNNKLYTGVPVRVCVNDQCVTKLGGTVLDVKHERRLTQ